MAMHKGIAIFIGMLIFIGAFALIAGYPIDLTLIALSFGLVTLVGVAVKPWQYLKGNAQIIVGAVLVLGIGFGVYGWMGVGPFVPPTATFTPTATVTPTTGTTALENYGEAATVDILLYDKENADPFTASEGLIRVYKNGEFMPSPIVVGASGATISAAIGDSVSVYGGNTTRYVEPRMNFLVDDARPQLNLDGHTAATAAQMKVTVKDDDNNALDAASNTSLADYNFTIGATATDTVTVELKTDTADVAFNLKAIAIATFGDINKVEIIQSPVGYTTGIVPQVLKDTDVTGSAAGTGNISKAYETVYVLNDAQLMPNWKEHEFVFEITSGSTDPAIAAGDIYSLQDGFIICFLDAVHDRSNTGQEVETYYTVDETEANVGVIEDFDVPVGKDLCTVVQAI